MQKDKKSSATGADPGPGHYQLDIRDKIKKLTDQLAPRYKDHPFGSNVDRFKIKDVSKSTKLTEDLKRQQELSRDLAEHTGIIKKPAEDRQRFRIQDKVKKGLKLNTDESYASIPDKSNTS